MKLPVAVILAAVLLSACKEEIAAIPDPVALTEDAVGHFCGMTVVGHGGPKAQIHLEGLAEPLFFVQTRDAIAFLMSPERDARVLATYVSDMGAAPSWDDPGAENWVDAGDAVFVVGADVAGGMGAPEVVPFADPAAAEAFIARHGGQAVPLSDIPQDAVTGPVDVDRMLETPS